MEDRDVPGLTRTTTDAQFFTDAVDAVIVGLALLVLVVVTAFVIPEQPLAIDRAWSELMSDAPSVFLKDLALVFNYAGRGLVRALSLVAIGVVLLRARRIVALFAFAVAESLAPLISTVIKALVDRPRPANAAIHASGSSFPSGHATYAGVTCVALVLLFTQPPRRRRWWALALVGIVGMAWSRTYLQAHWLSDVVAGSILGVAVALLAFGCAQMFPLTRSPSRENAQVDEARDELSSLSSSAAR